MKFSALVLLSVFYSHCSYADNLSDSNMLFDWAEKTYPEYFGPAGAPTVQIDDYLTRYYEKTDIYIGTSGNDVYVHGDVFGGLLSVGKISDFVKILPNSIVLKSISGGTFTMGGMTVADDAPDVNVTLSPFKMSEKEITNSEYIEFLNAALSDGWVTVESQQTADPCGMYTENMVIGAGDAPNKGEIFLQLGETGGCTSSGEEEHIDNKSYVSFDAALGKFELLDVTKADWPINWVKWYGANAFVKYYNVSLPTEAQWEYAARGGQQLQYPTDDGTLSLSKANYNGDSPGVYNPDGHSVAVGSYSPNPFGLFDMGGNVWEWCQDYYDAAFYTDGVTDPVNTSPGSDAKRVRRGGSWNYHSATLLSYARAADPENRGNNHFGFRIVTNE